jgi:hypothetical protein
MSSTRRDQAKPFQRATANAALDAFARSGGARRFLVADEVGLGKTIVARTIIAEMMRRRRGKPLVVFYVSSNLTIAHQNRRRLLEVLPDENDQKRAAAPADRLTLAANPKLRPTHPRLRLYTLTPDTSVPLYRGKGGAGRVSERALIFRLLVSRFPSLRRTLKQLCRGARLTDQTWCDALNEHATLPGMRKLRGLFFSCLARHTKLKPRPVSAETLEEAIRQHSRSRLLGAFRSALALAALAQVRPHLVIFDEFQKFRPMVQCDTQVDPVARAVRGEGSRRAALLLLSATPYRLYTSHADDKAGPSHHEEFYELIRFLFPNDAAEPSAVKTSLREFGAEMQLQTPDFSKLASLREEIQTILRAVMSRTERASSADGQLKCVQPEATLAPEDLRVFKDWVERLREPQHLARSRTQLTGYAVPYWWSVPLPAQMLGPSYVAWKAIDPARRGDEPRLRIGDRNQLRPRSWPHPQLRLLSEKILPWQRLALPWIAPSLRWWDLDGPWAAQGAAGGKLLIFSRFKAVPPALASLLSFGLESELASHGDTYLRTGQAQPLQLRRNWLALPALFFPAPTLIERTDPRRDHVTSLSEVKRSMRQQVLTLVKALGIRVRRSEHARPLWRLVAGLERRRELVEPDTPLPNWTDLRRALLVAAGAPGQRELMLELLRRWQRDTETGLTEITEAEVAVLARFALAGPGVVLGRALMRFDSNCLSRDRFTALVQTSWNGLRIYLNNAWFQSALSRRGQTYSDAILDAVTAGNLESVLDEHFWISTQLDADALPRALRDLQQALGLHVGRHQIYETSERKFSLRCHAAVPFADAKMESAASGAVETLRTDDLRRAFNTPFWPHVLATTSMGQEGLDFHVWCRQLLHWDLCHSPLDLEQREGRIQRFGGLSTRTTLSGQFADRIAFGPGKSPWQLLAELAEQEVTNDASGLSPWWGRDGEGIERHVVNLLHSRHCQRFEELSRLRFLYRLALGQPHQQDFIKSVSRLPRDGRERFALHLSAWRPQA